MTHKKKKRVSKPSKDSDSFIVAIRVRPENEEERSSKHRKIVRVCDDHMICFDPKPPNPPTGLFAQRYKDLSFAFDAVFDTQATQQQVFESTAARLIPEVLKGYNATMFAYGATGAGKTYTMLGNDQSGPGLLALTMERLFSNIRAATDRVFTLKVSYLEIYNEQIKDLLCPAVGTDSKSLCIREDPLLGPTVANLSFHSPDDTPAVMRLLAEGTERRSQSATAANARSSRSHAVFQLLLESRSKAAGASADILRSKLSLIDLAGSERASRTKNKGARLREGANINRSLLALGNCINALSSKGGKGYVPYRDSKLTRLLKDSLGGNTRTVMISNISPSSMCYEDIFNTLSYANRAKDIKVKVKKNVRSVNFHLSEYKRVISELKEEVQSLKGQLATAEEHARESGSGSSQAEQLAAEARKREAALLTSIKDDLQAHCRQHLDLSKQLHTVRSDLKACIRELDRKTRHVRIFTETNPNVPITAPQTPVAVKTAHLGRDPLRKRQETLLQLEKSLKSQLKAVSEKISSVHKSIPERITDPLMREHVEQFLQAHAARSAVVSEAAKHSVCRDVLTEQLRANRKHEDAFRAVLNAASELHQMARQVDPDMSDSILSCILSTIRETGVAINQSSPYHRSAVAAAQRSSVFGTPLASCRRRVTMTHGRGSSRLRPAPAVAAVTPSLRAVSPQSVSELRSASASVSMRSMRAGQVALTPTLPDAPKLAHTKKARPPTPQSAQSSSRTKATPETVVSAAPGVRGAHGLVSAAPKQPLRSRMIASASDSSLLAVMRRAPATAPHPLDHEVPLFRRASSGVPQPLPATAGGSGSGSGSEQDQRTRLDVYRQRRLTQQPSVHHNKTFKTKFAVTKKLKNLEKLHADLPSIENMAESQEDRVKARVLLARQRAAYARRLSAQAQAAPSKPSKRRKTKRPTPPTRPRVVRRPRAGVRVR